MKGEWRKISPPGYIGEPHVSSEENGELYEFETHDAATSIANFLNKSK
jgi:hypothetical protein